MKKVGFHGGSSLFELGTPLDMVCFFSVARERTELSEKESSLLNRLFRSYLRLDELDDAVLMMRKSKELLSTVIGSGDELSCLGWRSDITTLKVTAGSYTEVFAKYYEAFEHCAQSAKLFNEDWGLYRPVRTIVCDMPDFTMEMLRPLQEYDDLAGDAIPFWLR